MTEKTMKMEKGIAGDPKHESILAYWEKDKKEAPEIRKLPALSIDEIAAELGVEIDKLEDRFREEMMAFAKEMESPEISKEDEYYRTINLIYSLFLQMSDPKALEQHEWLTNLDSLDSFIDYLKITKHKVKNEMRKWVEIFINWRINPHRLMRIRVFPDGFKMWDQVHDSEGDWVLIPSRLRVHTFEYIDKSVVQEVIELIEKDYAAPDLHHASGSAALDGIADNKAILSARETINRGGKVKTGEFVSYASDESGYSVSGGEMGHQSVYAAKGNPWMGGYHTLSWFDQHPISFGIDEAKHREFRRSSDFKYDETSIEEEGVFVDYGSEGLLIGDEVPLSVVDGVYCLAAKRGEVEEWARQHCPQAEIISLEAIETLRFHEKTINSIALEEGINPKEVWNLLLES